MPELLAISPDKWAGHGSSCLGKSAMKQRLGYGSTQIMPAANADRVDASNSQERTPWRLPGSGWSASTGRESGLSRLTSAPDHELAGAVASSPRPNLPSSRCASYCSPCFRASGRLLLAESARHRQFSTMSQARPRAVGATYARPTITDPMGGRDRRQRQEHRRRRRPVQRSAFVQGRSGSKPRAR